MNFTNSELCTISNALIALISNAKAAKELVYDSSTHVCIDKEIENLIALNSKVCSIMSVENDME